MVDVAAFRGVRFAVADLGAVTCPPYDAVDPGLAVRLASRSPYNAVRLELPPNDPQLPRPGDPDRPPTGDSQDETPVVASRPSSGRPGRTDAYEQVAETYARWRREGVLRRDPRPALYVYEQRWADGVRRQRGVLAALGLSPWEDRQVVPHERIFPPAVADRRRLLETLAVNTSPVWVLGEGEPPAVTSALDEIIAGPPQAAFRDDAGVDNRLWVVTDRAFHATVRDGYADQRLLMADGHHRYTAAVEHLRATAPDAGRILAYVVGADGADGPDIQPMHRLAAAVPPDPAARLRAAGLRMEPVDTGCASARARQLEDRLRAAPRPAVGLLTDRLAAVVTVENRGRAAGWRSVHPGDQLAGLDTVLADDLLGGPLAGPVAGRSDGGTEDRAHTPPRGHSGATVYSPDLIALAGAVTAGRAAALLMVRPVTLATVRATAAAGRRMPPKTTAFFPKPRTGLVLRPLDAESPDPGAGPDSMQPPHGDEPFGVRKPS